MVLFIKGRNLDDALLYCSNIFYHSVDTWKRMSEHTHTVDTAQTFQRTCMIVHTNLLGSACQRYIWQKNSLLSRSYKRTAPVNFKLKVLQKKMSGIQLILILLAVAVNHGSIITCPASTFLQSSEITQNGGGTNFL